MVFFTKEGIIELGSSKSVLRQLTRSLLSNKIGNAKKEGFSIPINEWLVGSGKSFLLDTLSPENLSKFSFLDSQAITSACTKHLKGQAQVGFELWGLMILIRWLNNLKISARPKIIINSPLTKLNLPAWRGF